MCVLTFIPTEKNKFILTSNRDEAISRAIALPPQKYTINEQAVFFPKDPQGGGTWIASSGIFTLCLLNGAFEKHTPQPPYSKSRGQIIVDFYDFQDVKLFIESYIFDGIEPFTLIIIENNNNLTISELRWNGSQVFYKTIDPSRPHIWSSVTLYSPEIIKEREIWFDKLIETNPNANDVLNFHHNGGNGDERNNIKMNREHILKTISITQFEFHAHSFTIHYEDLQTNEQYNNEIYLESMNVI